MNENGVSVPIPASVQALMSPNTMNNVSMYTRFDPNHAQMGLQGMAPLGHNVSPQMPAMQHMQQYVFHLIFAFNSQNKL